MAAWEMIEGTGVCLCNYLNSASVLTLSSHHALCVPLGQHPHVTIETRLLHWGGMMKCLSVQTVNTESTQSIDRRHFLDFNTPLGSSHSDLCAAHN